MSVADLYIAGTGRWLPPAVTVAEAEAAGLCRRRALWRTEVEAVRVSPGDSGPEMAARAARAALRQAGASPADIDLLLHATTYYQGHDMWAPASYVQRVALGGSTCPAIEVRQMSNGGMAALELATGWLRGAPDRAAALLTTGDRFCPPGVDRWRSDAGTPYGDGGTALVLSRRGGFARLRALVTYADPGLEAMHRGDDPFGAAPFAVRQPMDLEPPRRDFVAGAGLDTVLSRIDTGQRETLKRCLAEAGVAQADVDWYVLPHLGRPRLDAHFLRPLGIDVERTTWSWGRSVGHLGAGDQLAGFGRLADSGALAPGQLCLLAGVGAGFSWSCAVVEVLGRPESTGDPGDTR
ncbi:ketoacyl-ACP synthase III family protein [Streptomyces sp. ADMS]|uniref:ketoacyl-ACP synthase III family protein n=1 Tax=Streptomyces sp. ADMS TaxID=3071415 RepID=UPI00296E55FD|nr:ketoacyl-ACP synthase III family protein [Streptomyces sp. ADMS]MDW4905900.1 ketoacyl-ACP synthase III family protein [Streptomyces sp. ADMS]